jgi:hypothetical protein
LFATNETEKGALVRQVAIRSELTGHRIVIVRMDPHLAKPFIILVTIGFAMGFASGYGIRAGISHYRRAIARRNRMLIE